MVYQVIVCPDEQCRGVSIINESGETITCRKCDSQYKSDKYKFSYRTDDSDEAVEARTKLLIKINEDERSYEELQEEGLLDVPEGGVYDKSQERDTRSPQEIIRSSVEEVELATEENIIDYAVSEGLDREKADKLLERLIQSGYAIRLGEEIELL